MKLLLSQSRRSFIRFFVLGLSFSQCKEDDLSPILNIKSPMGKSLFEASSKIKILWKVTRNEYLYD